MTSAAPVQWVLRLAPLCMLLACGAEPPPEVEPQASWMGVWSVVAWNEQLYPLRTSGFNEADGTFSSMTTEGELRADAAEFVVEIFTTGVVIDASGDEEDVEEVLVHRGEVRAAGDGVVEVGLVESGESVGYLMLCGLRAETIFVCEKVQMGIRYSSVFLRGAP